MKILSSRFIAPLLVFVAGFVPVPWIFAADPDISTNREPHFFSKKAWAICFGMEGTGTNVTFVDGRIHFQIKGRFWFTQLPPESTRHVVIEEHPIGGFSATVTPDSFVAMTKNWAAGSVVNDKEKLLKILSAAAERRTVLKFSLTHPKMDFGGERFALLDAKVWRVTDVDLR